MERDKVAIYAELANVLFTNLFGFAFVEDPARKTELLGEFLAAWAEAEHGLRTLVDREISKTGRQDKRPVTFTEGLRLAYKNNLLDAGLLEDIEQLRTLRNRATHGEPGWENMLTQDKVEQVRHWAKLLKSGGAA